MSRKLTITVDDGVYDVLHPDLSEGYRLMAADEACEAEAHEWVEGTCRDVAPPPYFSAAR